MKLSHAALIDLLRRAYSAEKAAAFAYQGHAGSLKDEGQKAAVRQIELDEWVHRGHVLRIMEQYEISVSKFYEFKFHVIGKAISFSCYIIGRFMPFYFAGRLESGNVCEYFRMMHYFHELGINEHDSILFEMGLKEKEHELYFLERVSTDRFLPFFQKLFAWGEGSSFNDVDMNRKYSLESAENYCRQPRVPQHL